MPVILGTPRNRRPRPGRLGPHLQLEALEDRSLLSIAWPGLTNPVAEAEPNDTLNLAQQLGNLTVAGQAGVVGTVGNSPAGAADVDWYQFTLTAAAHVHLATLDKGTGSTLVSVLGLYNTDAKDFLNGYWGDPLDPLNHRLLAQSDGATAGGDAAVDRDLAAGTYYVAVSGSGNDYFNPFVAGSGLFGSPGSYGLLVTATALPVDPAGGPVVLATDPAGGSVLASSPLVLRIDLSSGLDPSTLDWYSGAPFQTVWLTYNPNGTFGDGNDQQVALQNVAFSTTANELQLTPAGALAPGYYQVFLAGNSQGGAAFVLADPGGNPLGMDALHPDGQDYQFTFRVNGYEGNTTPGAGADDTPPTAHQLGDITQAGLVQAVGTIGDDPYFNLNSADPVQANPGNDVDLYHFTVSGPGRYALTAETFVGRIGSPLLAQNSLYRRSVDANGNVVYTLVGSNSGTGDPTPASGGPGGLWKTPLANDPVLYAGLTAGDYYLAVSTANNNPDLSQPSHSAGSGGTTTGTYVLNLLVQPDNTPPQVVAVTIADGSTLTAPPTTFNVTFSEQVNVPQASAVYVLDPATGTKYSPRLLSYDSATNQASFMMLDGLPNGAFELHLSGNLGLTDVAGNPLAGNDPSGDYVVHFTVNGPARGTAGNPLLWTDQGLNNSPTQPQNLGVLFPNELQAGVTITRDYSTTPVGPGDGADYYQFQLLQGPRIYGFNFSSAGLPPGVQLTLMDAMGNVIPGFPAISPTLYPGTYVLGITGLPTTQPAGAASYQVVITLVQSQDNPPPITTGAAPAVGLRLQQSPPPPPQSGPTGGPTGGAPGGTTGGPTGGTTSGNPSSDPPPSGTTAPPPSLVLQGVGPVAPAVLVLTVPSTGVNASVAGPISAVVPATATRPADGGPVDTGIPSGALTVLSAGPVGGVRDVNPVNLTAFPDRLALPGPVSFSAQAVMRSAATQSTTSSADEELESPSGAGWLKLLKKYLRAVETLWNEFRQSGAAETPGRDGRVNEGRDESAPPGGGLNRTALPIDSDEGLADATALEATFDPPCDDTWCSFAAEGPWSGPLAALAVFTALALQEPREDSAAERLRRAGW